MNYQITIDYEVCKGCGTCRDECNHHLPVYKGAPPSSAEVNCIGCLHCYAVCPENAISVDSGPPAGDGSGSTDVTAGVFEHLVTGRRSCRSFAGKAIDSDTLLRVIEFANQIPSGGNSHSIELTVLSRTGIRAALERKLEKHYRAKVRLLKSSFLRRLAALMCDSETKAFIKDEFYLHQITYLLEQFDRGLDPIFYSAPVAILVHTRKLIPTPAEDCTLAAYNMSLAAQTMGLGSCLVSLAQKGMNGSRSMKKLVGMSSKDAIHAVLVLGHPDVHFRRPVRHTLPSVNFPV